MFGAHPGLEPIPLDLSEINLTPDADAVLTEIVRALLPIFECVPRKPLELSWRGYRRQPMMLPDQLIPSHERVKAPDSEIALQVHAKRARLDPKSMPRYRRQFKRRFSDV